MMVQNDIHRSHVLPLFGVAGKTEDTRWFLMSLQVVVKGCGRKDFACSGNGNGTSWNNRGSNGNYWSASFNSARNARNLNFNSGGVNPQNNNNRYNGFAVRPVQHTILKIVLFLILVYGSESAAAITRPVSSLLRCEEAQVESLVCGKMGAKPEGEHGAALRRPVLSEVQAFAVKVLRDRLSKEEGDIRCRVQGQDRTPSVFQLYPRAVRKDVHSGLVFVHQGTRNTLRHREDYRLLQKGESQLAAKVLRDALGYTWVFYAYQPQEAAGDIYRVAQEDGHTSHQQVFGKDVERRSGYGLRCMAVGDNHHARPEGELHRCGRPVGLDRTRPCEEYAAAGGRSWTAYRQPDESVVLERVPERVRPVHETGTEVPMLWQVRGRCSGGECRQGVAAFACAENQGVPESRAWVRPAYGQAGDIGGSSWSGVLGSVHQAVEDVHQQPCPGEDDEEDCHARLLEAVGGAEVCQLVPRYIQARAGVQALQEDIHEEGISAYRHIRQGYDKVHRQIFIL